MDYTNFQTYPLEIYSINESYNEELEAIKAVVIDEMNYSGDVEDLVYILPFFVFLKFCESKESVVSASNGENLQVSDLTVPSRAIQRNAWNIGVKKLKALILSNNETADIEYLSEILVIGGFVI